MTFLTKFIFIGKIVKTIVELFEVKEIIENSKKNLEGKINKEDK